MSRITYFESSNGEAEFTMDAHEIAFMQIIPAIGETPWSVSIFLKGNPSPIRYTFTHENVARKVYLGIREQMDKS